jgi:hypothetical protein
LLKLVSYLLTDKVDISIALPTDADGPDSLLQPGRNGF